MNVLNVFAKPNEKNRMFTIPMGATGLAYGDITKASYVREGAAADVAITPADATLGTYTSGGFKEIDGTNAPGLYQFGVPNAALVQGCKAVDIIIHVAGALAEDLCIHINLIRALAY